MTLCEKGPGNSLMAYSTCPENARVSLFGPACICICRFDPHGSEITSSVVINTTGPQSFRPLSPKSGILIWGKSELSLCKGSGWCHLKGCECEARVGTTQYKGRLLGGNNLPLRTCPSQSSLTGGRETEVAAHSIHMVHGTCTWYRAHWPLGNE